MKYSIVFSTISLFAVTRVAYAVPTKRGGPTDADILNFALTLEHLESAFYMDGLAKYSEQDFLHAGQPSWVRGRYEQISAHENAHVKFLEGALAEANIQAVKPCAYSFPHEDPKSFIEISSILESVGTAAYTGASGLISNKDYVDAAASILGVEARHDAWIHASAMKRNPWSAPYEVSLSRAQAFTLALPFIKSCPPSNPDIHVQPFPSLALPADTTPGRTTTFAYKSEYAGSTYAAFTSGHETIFVELDQASKKVETPKSLKGEVFVFVTKTNEEITDDSIIAGPAAANFAFGANGKLDS